MKPKRDGCQRRRNFRRHLGVNVRKKLSLKLGPSPKTEKEYTVHVAQYSDIGPRDNLEDAAGALVLSRPTSSEPDVFVAVVCDGVGGNSHGEVASALGLRQTLGWLAGYFGQRECQTHLMSTRCDAILAALANALESTNRAILRRIAEAPRLRGMSTTIVCVVIVEGNLYVAWAGDSRCYLCRAQEAERISTDDTEVEPLIRENLLTAAEAKDHPLAHVITNFLGNGEFHPSISVRRLEPGDVVLLCTDGLTDVLTDAEIAAHVGLFHAGSIRLDELPFVLVQDALDAGTQDNVTVLVCEYAPDVRSQASPGHTRIDKFPLEMARACQRLTKGAMK